MKPALLGRVLAGMLTGLVLAPAWGSEPDSLAHKAQEVLQTNCHRCHGQEGAVEGGFNYVVDLERLVARKKVIPGDPAASPLFRRVLAGKMPPPGQNPRPSETDLALLRQWIESGAPSVPASAPRSFLADADVTAAILADLDTLDRRSRRFTRYFSLAPQANAGLSEDELQTYRNALAKLLNSLSWHPRITLPQAVGPDRVLLRIDLRDFQWDANLWNRILTDYPYGVFQDTATARACAAATATRMPCVRADWFIATASRPPLYQDLLQLPTNSAELERQLRIDVLTDIQQERVARAGFNGSGISRNNRLIERHDSVHGVYWRTYDFDAIPQNLVDRPNLLPDRRNLFAYPLGPASLALGGKEGEGFQHAGGEIIFNLPNGLQAYMLVNALNQRIDKGPLAIVSDPKRPDRAVETGVSCMGCHYRGILPKDDQIRAYVEKNPGAFPRADAELIKALYVPETKMRSLMDEDAERFRRALEKTGNKVSVAEPIITLTLRYEADLDLPVAAAEAGLPVKEFLARLSRSEVLPRNLGSLKLPGGTVHREVQIQTFADIVREMRLGTLFDPGSGVQTLPDNTGDLDPLEAQSSPANSTAFSADGRLALFAANDRTVRLWDVEGEHDIRRFIGHTASVWSVAFSPDGRRALSGSADSTVRLWEVETGRELLRLEGHTGLVTAVAFSPDGRRALSGGYDHTVILWDLEKGTALRTFPDLARYVNALAFTPDGHRCLVAGENVLHLVDLDSGKELRTFEGHTDSVTAVAVAPDGHRVLSASDDGSVRLWDLDSGRIMRSFQGHTSFVKCVAFSPDGQQALSGGSDRTVRLWDVETGRERKQFAQHADTVSAVAFTPSGRESLSGSREAVTRVWVLAPPPDVEVSRGAPPPQPVPTETSSPGQLRPAAVIPVGGTIGSLLLSPDRQRLYFLNRSANKLGRVNLETGKREGDLALPEATEVLAQSPDGKILFAAVAGGSRNGGNVIQVIDPVSLQVRKSLRVPTEPYDLVATENGLVFVSGGSGDWTDIALLDVNREALVARWGGVWTRSFLRLTPNQKRLYWSSQGVTPGYIEGVTLPGQLEQKPATVRSPSSEKNAVGGEFLISPDGHYLLCKTGTVLRLTADGEGDLQPGATVEPFVAADVDPTQGAVLVLTAEGLLKRYSYPDFKPQATYRLGVVGYQLVVDEKRERLYVAGFDPQTLGSRPRARGFGDVFVYDLKQFLQARAR